MGTGGRDCDALGILVPAVPKIGRAVWSVGCEMETAREDVPFEVREAVEFVKTGVRDFIGVVVGDGKKFA